MFKDPRSKKLPLSGIEVEQIIALGGGHSHVIDFVLEKCRQYGVHHALNDIGDVYLMRRERARIFLDNVHISKNARYLLSVLTHYFNVPAEFAGHLFPTHNEGAEACAELLDHNIIVEADGIFSISPPLADRVPQDRRFLLDPKDGEKVAMIFAGLLNQYRDESSIPVNIIDAASIASIESRLAGGKAASRSSGNWASLIILPSHYIYLARLAYNRRQFSRAVEYCTSAFGYQTSLSRAAYIFACRIFGMSAAREGLASEVKLAVSRLNAINDPYARACAAFVRGFDLRLRGDFAKSQSEYELALRTIKNDISLLRELAQICLLRRDYIGAIAYGERALSRRPDLPYVLDIVARSLIASTSDAGSVEYDFKIQDILARLNASSDNTYQSFYQLRTADRELRLGQLEKALKAANDAVNISRELAAPYLMRAHVHIAMNNIKDAKIDRDEAKRLTKVGRARYRYFDAELIRIEIEIAVKERTWGPAISMYRQLSQFGVRDESEIAKSIARGIDRDRTMHESYIRNFAIQFRR